MSTIFLLKDKNPQNFKKPFVQLYKDKNKLEQDIRTMRHKLKTEQEKSLITFETLNVSDFDPNRNSIYLVMDKKDPTNKKPIIGAFSVMKNADIKLNAVRSKESFHNKKLIVMQTASLL